jgi:autotransporter family porin
MRSTVVLVLVVVALLAAACGSSTQTRAGSSTSPAAVIGHVDAPSAAPSVTPSSSSSAAARPNSSAPPSKTAAPTHFGTLPPGARLPSDAQCAAWVRAMPVKENKGVNRAANARTGQHVDGSLFSGDTATARSYIAPRIDGNFTGTTPEILRWTACKWGIDENIVYAQAAIESWWRQDTLGDWDSNAGACPPGHGLGADGQSGKCPQSYGVLQDRWPYMKQGWPGFGRSTAMDADLAYGIWRGCFEGYETWLNTVEQGQKYTRGDAWGCVGRWFSGRWHTSAGDGYVSRVKQYESQKIWTTHDFQQP